ncbi:MAG: hypothetical protein MI866_03860, partial [Bacteroidales bacterium]|nr:hypothetical protein [Bacteroidales bacterium]
SHVANVRLAGSGRGLEVPELRLERVFTMSTPSLAKTTAFAAAAAVLQRTSGITCRRFTYQYFLVIYLE